MTEPDFPAMFITVLSKLQLLSESHSHQSESHSCLANTVSPIDFPC